jgi:hypothetical protein
MKHISSRVKDDEGSKCRFFYGVMPFLENHGGIAHPKHGRINHIPVK